MCSLLPISAATWLSVKMTTPVDMRITGRAKIELSYQLMGDLVFIGCSLSDPDLVAILNAFGRMRHTTVNPILTSPFAFLAVNEHSDKFVQMIESGVTLEEAVSIESDRLRSKWNLRPIWYEWDPSHSKLDSDP